MEASSTSTVWAMPIGRPERSIAEVTCIRQPGLAVTSSWAPVATMLAALRSPSSSAGSGLSDVVDAGRAAAQLGLGDLPQLEPGDGLEQPARLGADALGVAEVAGVVVGDGDSAAGAAGRPGPARRGSR